MSDSANMAGRDEIWIEKYRPQSLDEIVGHPEITDRLKSYVERGDLSHLLFAGPAGTGKCVTGDTPVLTGQGLRRIKDIVGDVDGFAEPDDLPEVLTFTSEGRFSYVEPTQVFSRDSETLVEIESRDGVSVEVTPEHPFLTISESGLEWKQAEDLQSGDRIARPLETPQQDTDDSLAWLEKLDGERTLVNISEEFAKRHDIPPEEEYVGAKKRVVRGLRTGESLSAIAEDAGIKRKTAMEYKRVIGGLESEAVVTTCSLTFLRTTDASRTELRDHIESIQFVGSDGRLAPPVKPVWELTPRIAALVGLLVSEARIDGGRIRFYNTDDRLLDRVDRTVTEAFGAETERDERHGVPFVRISNRSLVHFLEACFGVFDGPANGRTGGSELLQATEAARSAFLQAVFDAEGHVDRDGLIELTQKDGDVVTLVGYLLTSLGITNRRKTKHKAATNGTNTEREYHVLYVSGSKNLRKFQQKIGFTDESKASTLKKHAKKRSNPNHDTIPVQEAVGTLCERLYLRKSELLTGSLNPETPGRENYLEDLDRILKAASAKLETAQKVQERIDRLQSAINAVVAVPAKWAEWRGALEPLATRKEIATETGIETGRLLEYADGRRTPHARRVEELLVEVGATDDIPPVERVQTELETAVEALGIPYEGLADGTDQRGTGFINLLRNDGHAVRRLPQIATVAERIKTVAAGMLSEEVLEALSTLELVVNADLHYDEIERVDRRGEACRVYDLTVPETHNYVAGDVPVVMHNTAAATAIAKELYGEDWRSNFLELNASDDRGIDVVRERIKNFARSSFGGYDFRIIFLDESDALTSEAQSALRRTMEQFSDSTRFILSCNYSSQIIDPIQSRCAVFRFSPLDDEAVADRIRYIADQEGIELTDDGVDALVYAADGDMRRAINALQAAAVMGETVNEETVFTITSTARPEDIEAMVTDALEGEFLAAKDKLDELLSEQGLAGGDVIDQLHRSVWNFDLEDEAAVRLLDRIGEADYRITEGANERIQLEALLAAIALEDGRAD